MAARANAPKADGERSEYDIIRHRFVRNGMRRFGKSTVKHRSETGKRQSHVYGSQKDGEFRSGRLIMSLCQTNRRPEVAITLNPTPERRRLRLASRFPRSRCGFKVIASWQHDAKPVPERGQVRAVDGAVAVDVQPVNVVELAERGSERDQVQPVDRPVPVHV